MLSFANGKKFDNGKGCDVADCLHLSTPSTRWAFLS